MELGAPYSVQRACHLLTWNRFCMSFPLLGFSSSPFQVEITKGFTPLSLSGRKKGYPVTDSQCTDQPRGFLSADLKPWAGYTASPAQNARKCSLTGGALKYRALPGSLVVSTGLPTGEQILAAPHNSGAI